MSPPCSPARAAPSAPTKQSRPWRWRSRSYALQLPRAPRGARLRSLRHHALPASGSRCRHTAPCIARRADRRRVAVVRRQAGIRLLLAPLRRHHGGRRGRVGRPARAVPAQSRRPVLLAAGCGQWHWSAPAAEIAAALQRSQLRAPAEMGGIAIAQRTARAGRACWRSSATASRCAWRRVRSASPSAARSASIRCAATDGRSRESGQPTGVRGHRRRPRSRALPARRRPDGRRRAQAIARSWRSTIPARHSG